MNEKRSNAADNQVPQMDGGVQDFRESVSSHRRSIEFHQRRSFLQSLEFERVAFLDDQNIQDSRNAVNDGGSIPRGAVKFSQQFESGNLKRVVKMSEFEYDCELRPDSKKGTTMWFNFQLFAVPQPGVYIFNIVNLVKPESLYNEGLQPCVFSRRQRIWKPAGGKCCYFGSHVERDADLLSYVLSFELHLYNPEDTTVSEEVKAAGLPWSQGDVYCLAHTFPFTYTDLMLYIASLESQVVNLNMTAPTSCPRSVKNRSTGATIQCGSMATRQLHFKSEVLCQTLEGRDVPVLTIYRGARPPGRYVVITARVHPGEANSSWVLKGVLDQAVSNTHLESFRLLLTHTLVVIPMLNPDGVALGHYRGDSLGVDLNRVWRTPSFALHPTIEATKRLIKRLHMEGITATSVKNSSPSLPSSDDVKGGCNVVAYFDLHGHTRKKKVFMYGNHHRASKIVRAPRGTPGGGGSGLGGAVVGGGGTLPHYEKMMPTLFAQTRPDLFTLDDCTYGMGQGGSKDGTARVVVWEELGVSMSYTVESSFLSQENSTYTVADYLSIGKGLITTMSDYLNLSPQNLVELSGDITRSQRISGTAVGKGDAVDSSAKQQQQQQVGFNSSSGIVLGSSSSAARIQRGSRAAAASGVDGSSAEARSRRPYSATSERGGDRRATGGTSIPQNPRFFYDDKPPFELHASQSKARVPSSSFASSARGVGGAGPSASLLLSPRTTTTTCSSRSKSLVEKLIQMRRQQHADEYPRFGQKASHPKRIITTPTTPTSAQSLHERHSNTIARPQLRVSLIRPSRPTQYPAGRSSCPPSPETRANSGSGGTTGTQHGSSSREALLSSSTTSKKNTNFTTLRQQTPSLFVQAQQQPSRYSSKFSSIIGIPPQSRYQHEYNGHHSGLGVAGTMTVSTARSCKSPSRAQGPATITSQGPATITSQGPATITSRQPARSSGGAIHQIEGGIQQSNDDGGGSWTRF